MDRYQRVEKPREETPIRENEIRIMTQGRMRNYITYAINLIQEKGANEIVFKAMGRAINKTVMIVELIKRRIVGLHQITTVGSIDITDTWEPLEEGLLPIETTRHVSMITVTLSKVELDKSHIGYQPPLPEDQVRPMADLEFNDEEGAPGGRRGRGGRGRGRGRGNYNGGTNGGPAEYNNVPIEGGYDSRPARGGGHNGNPNGYPARGRGGGFRGGRGRRGGYGPAPRNEYHQMQDGPRNEYQAQDGGAGGGREERGFYGDAPPVRGRGRGRGRARGGRGMGRGRGDYRPNGNGNGPNGPNGLNGPNGPNGPVDAA